VNPFGIAVEAWHLWVLVGLGLAIAELLGAQFVLFALGVSCLAGAAAAAWTDWGLQGQLTVTLVAAAAITPLFVTLMRRLHTKRQGPLDTGWERGREAVTERYAGRIGVRLNGDFYPARLADGSPPPAGVLVRVERIEGNTARIARLEEEYSG
jgi:membrane protein implicated in regulation of membrane protease activity